MFIFWKNKDFSKKIIKKNCSSLNNLTFVFIINLVIYVEKNDKKGKTNDLLREVIKAELNKLLKKEFSSIVRETRRTQLVDEFGDNIYISGRAVEYIENNEKLISTTTLFTLLGKKVISIKRIEEILPMIYELFEKYSDNYE